MKKNKKTIKKKFVAILKVGQNSDGSSICYKHWFNDINKYTEKILPKYKPWWANYYFNTGENKGKQFASWTRSRGIHSVIK